MVQQRITGHKAVRAALRDTETYSSDLQGDADVRNYRQLPLEVDPPRHHLFRAALSPMFVRPRIQELQPEFRAIALRVLDDFERHSGGDFVQEVALRYVIECLGVIYNRPQDVEEWRTWGPDVWTAEGTGRSGSKLHAYLERAYKEAGTSAQQDIWNFVRAISIDDDAITFEEFQGIAGVLLAGGRDTVVKLLSGTAWHLVTTPDDVAELIAQEVTLEAAIQEMLRVFTPLPAMLRVTPDQQQVPDDLRDPDKYVAIDFRSANYDPDQFPDPDVIDIRRTKVAHVAFGFGPHTCIGNHVAEVETLVLFQEILPRIHKWALRAAPQIHWQDFPHGRFPERFENLEVTVASAISAR